MLDHTAAKKTFEAALRCIFGTEAAHMSLLYFLTYVSGAGSLTALLSSRAKLGGQEFRVVVRPLQHHCVTFVLHYTRNLLEHN